MSNKLILSVPYLHSHGIRGSCIIRSGDGQYSQMSIRLKDKNKGSKER